MGVKHTKVCGNPDCSISTGFVDELLTFGSGELDDYGYWEKPCSPCARAWEAAHPEDGECWPFQEVFQVTYTHADGGVLRTIIIASSYNDALAESNKRAAPNTKHILVEDMW